MDFERIKVVRSDDRCDEVWIHIPALEDDALEGAHLVLPLLIRIHECWCEFVEGEMWLVGIEEEEFFHLGDVFVLVVGVSDESRQRGEWDNNIWIEWTGLVEMGKELLHTTGLVLQHHHRQTLGTIYSLTRH